MADLDLGTVTSYGLARENGFVGSNTAWVKKIMANVTEEELAAINDAVEDVDEKVDAAVETINDRIDSETDSLSDRIDNLSSETATSVAALTADVAMKINADDVDAGFVHRPEDSPEGTDGQLLRTHGDGTTEWVDEGLPTDAQTATAVTAWLDAHPEATTTVEDGAITAAKLNSDIKDDVLSIPGLKSAIDASTLCKIHFAPVITKGKGISTSTGKNASNSTNARTGVINGYSEIIAINLTNTDYLCGVMYYDQSGDISTGAGYLNDYSDFSTGVQYIPAKAIKFALRFKRADGAAISDSDVSAISAALYAYSATDATLTKKGLSADAKVTGDCFEKEIVFFGIPETWSNVWEQGSIRTTDGEQASNSTRIRFFSYMKIGSELNVQIPSGMKVFCARYAQENVASYIGSTEFETGNAIYRFPGEYVRLVAAYTDDSSINASAGANVIRTNILPTDKSLSLENKSADAKATGDLVDSVVNTLQETVTGELILEQGNINSYNGGGTSSTTRIRTKGYLLVTFGFEFVVPDGLKAFIYYYEKEAYTSKKDSSGDWLTGTVHVDYPTGRYIRIVLAYTDDSAITPSDVSNPISITRYVLYGENEQQEVEVNYGSDSWGISNVIANSAHIAEIKWTPVAPMPMTPHNAVAGDPPDYFTVEEHTGIPYSSVRDQDKAVGMDVSIHTFMTAVKDPNSVLYTRLSLVSNSMTYYGTVCSGMINYSEGIGLDLTNYYLSDSDMFETIPMISIQKGDMIWVDGHCALVYNVEKDTYGRITSVTVREEIRPLPRTIRYKSWDAFMESRGEYIARRFKNIAGVQYTQIPYVQCFDEVPPSSIEYPDVQTDHGDRAVFKVGEDVKVNVINVSDFTKITVTRGGATVFSTNTIAPFTLENVQAGLYTITADGGENESVSTFFVVNCTGSFDTSTGIVTFSSTNATPVLVNVYNLPSNLKITCKPIILTDADREAGQINVSEYMSSEYKYAKVTFMTDYGTAVWYSESHTKWTPVST